MAITLNFKLWEPCGNLKTVANPLLRVMEIPTFQQTSLTLLGHV